MVDLPMYGQVFPARIDKDVEFYSENAVTYSILR